LRLEFFHFISLDAPKEMQSMCQGFPGRLGLITVLLPRLEVGFVKG
jgi:hypothetical protein